MEVQVLGFIACAAFLVSLTSSAEVGQDSSLVNPTKRTCKDELIRLKTPAPGAGTFVVKQDGVEVPYQVEEIDGKQWILFGELIDA